MANKIVTIIYRFMPQYRYDFFCGLKDELQKDNVVLNLVYGKYKHYDKNDTVDIDWGMPVKNKVLKIGSHQLTWIPTPKKTIQESDLIILMQENKILSNYPLLLQSILRKKKIALWGHGVNYQAKNNSLGNRFKKFYARKVHWWFAYTEKNAERIALMGVNPNQITVVENAIDTQALVGAAAQVTINDLAGLRKEKQIGDGPIGIYCGAMYEEKRIDFLIEACLSIRKTVPNFEMIFLGAGIEAYKVGNASGNYPWIHYLGPKFGADRVPYFKMAHVFLMPGLVGLAILDSFALEVPLITTKYEFHSPEIDYLVNGENGIITENDLNSYTQEIVNILTNRECRTKLISGCQKASLKYTNENMVRNFAQGIKRSLS
jgi:glycosyltransferase involved in cell wall biosynthesis